MVPPTTVVDNGSAAGSVDILTTNSRQTPPRHVDHLGPIYKYCGTNVAWSSPLIIFVMRPRSR
jgi:hypothetical protein